MYKVYIQTDPQTRIIAINSGEFLPDITDWTQIDEGDGDKYHHAQGNYFEKPLMTMQGVYQYKHDATKLMGQRAVERTTEEMAADVATIPPPPPTQDEVIKDLVALLIAQGVIR